MPDFCSLGFGGKLCALELDHLREVLEPLPVTPVPLSPPGLKGVVNLRGELVPVMAWDPFLGFTAGDVAVGRRPWMAVLQIQECVMGVLVESVDTLRDVEPGQIQQTESSDGLFTGSIRVGTNEHHLVRTEALLERVRQNLGQSTGAESKI